MGRQSRKKRERREIKVNDETAKMLQEQLSVAAPHSGLWIFRVNNAASSANSSTF